MNRIENQFSERLNKGEKLFISYVMAGDGGLEVLGGRLALLEKFGASAIEIGIPFSDPVADGPVIQQAGIRALQEGTTLKGVLEKIKEIRQLISVPLIMMTYMNPILAYGIDKFISDLEQSGIDGCIIPDLPIEEEEIISFKLEKIGVELIRLVTMATPKDRIEKIAEKGRGFLYTVTVKGITGVRNELDNSLSSFLKSVKEVSNKPVVAGFGVSSPEQVKELCQDCDGVVVGSKIVDLFNENKINEIKHLVESILIKEEAI
ncbi:tryptophan synthase subunit alpha [Gottfriedia luciferensis]|uniref:tryptophan synthase subunit alpha n=1 Tax=Gottfriedia luciferensis TaxID=178774 RepID=UPI000B43DA4F|nr:tryptophan synthase subunit alpha [Gottfriedia luciferensis]